MSFVMTIPIRTVSGMNVREHPMARHTRVKKERKAVGMFMPMGGMFKYFKEHVPPPYTITLVRMKPRGGPLDDDNLRASMKAVRDEVSRLLGIDDGDKKNLRWKYGEMKGVWGVRVIIDKWVCDNPWHKKPEDHKEDSARCYRAIPDFIEEESKTC